MVHIITKVQLREFALNFFAKIASCLLT